MLYTKQGCKGLDILTCKGPILPSLTALAITVRSVENRKSCWVLIKGSFSTQHTKPNTTAKCPHRRLFSTFSWKKVKKVNYTSKIPQIVVLHLAYWSMILIFSQLWKFGRHLKNYLSKLFGTLKTPTLQRYRILPSNQYWNFRTWKPRRETITMQKQCGNGSWSEKPMVEIWGKIESRRRENNLILDLCNFSY